MRRSLTLALAISAAPLASACNNHDQPQDCNAPITTSEFRGDVELSDTLETDCEGSRLAIRNATFADITADIGRVMPDLHTQPWHKNEFLQGQGYALIVKGSGTNDEARRKLSKWSPEKLQTTSHELQMLATYIQTNKSKIIEALKADQDILYGTGAAIPTDQVIEGLQKWLQEQSRGMAHMELSQNKNAKMQPIQTL